MTDTGFPSTGLGEALCVPQKPRSCTEDSSLTTASSTPVEIVDNLEEEENNTVSDSLALLNVSRSQKIKINLHVTRQSEQGWREGNSG